MPGTALHASLTKRERQIMDRLYRLGRATANEILDGLAGSPSSSTVRTQLRVLESKGFVRHEEEGLRFVYMPTVSRHAGCTVPISWIRAGSISTSARRHPPSSAASSARLSQPPRQ